MLLALALLASRAAAESPADPTPPRPDPQLVALGRQLYESGTLVSGQPLTAVVQRDVAVEGAQLTCVGCHQRSGMGWVEGATQVPPITGTFLYQPREQRKRPAYSDETLARAVREGVDPSGRSFGLVMPRYQLPERDMQALVAYLKTLSAETSPGVTDEVLRFATVVSDGVSPAAQKAMLDLLAEFFKEKNSGTRLETRRAKEARRGSVRPRANRAYRKWELSVWALHGPAESWPAQLDAYFRQQPVFALISGIAVGSWKPIHDFCERERVPCILPNTDRPVVSEGDFYTIYFSKGLTLEAQALAAQLSREKPERGILQVFRQDSAGAVAAAALRAELGAERGATIVDLQLPADGPFAPDLVAQAIDKAKPSVVALWLSREDLATAPGKSGAAQFYLSSTLLETDLASVPPAIRAASSVLHPFLLPEAMQPGMGRLHPWLARRGMQVVAPRIQAQTFFACAITGEALMHVGYYFHRDYFVEAIDHVTGIPVIYYPRLSFGPGQRYLAKGCYVLKLGKDAQVESSSWLALGR